MDIELLRKYEKTKYIKLILAILIDLIGYVSYSIPALFEFGDIIWGPLSGILIFLLFPKRKLIALGGVVEELIPFTDFIPAALIAWSIDYIKDNNKTLAEFEKKFGKTKLIE